jgi:hypothetical protein
MGGGGANLSDPGGPKATGVRLASATALAARR